MIYLLSVLVVLTVAGCSGLAITDEESGMVTAGKVAARVVLCPVTLCFSELGMAEQRRQAEREEARAQEQARYRAWVRTLSPEQQERERDRQARLDAAMLQAWGMSRQTWPFHHEPVSGSQPPRALTCTTIGSGGYANTLCR